jgi:CRP/FNR family transcriptional regulator, cyclic AMP receptor protein
MPFGRNAALRKEDAIATHTVDSIPLPFRDLRERVTPGSYPRLAQLCMEGYPAEGVFAISSGKVKEYVTSKQGKMVIVRIARAGDIIGLDAVIGDAVYGTSAETIEPVNASFISRRELLNSLRSDEHFRLMVAKQLSDGCRCAYKGIRRIALATSVTARVAHFLLDWAQDSFALDGRPCLRINLTHEEIGQVIGTSRETVSRIVSSFRRKGWIRVKGIQWTIENPASLAALISQP